MTSARKTVLGILCVAGVGGVGLLHSACDLISDDGSGQTGTLQLLLSDAPFPFAVISEASVTITRVEVRLSSSGTDGTGEESSEGAADSDDQDADDANDDEEDGQAADSIVDGTASNGGFLTILNDPVSFNLLELQAGVTASLANTQLTAGTYTQIRLIVSSGHVTLTDGREFDLTVPSGEQTGIKLRFDFTITSAETRVIVT